MRLVGKGIISNRKFEVCMWVSRLDWSEFIFPGKWPDVQSMMFALACYSIEFFFDVAARREWRARGLPVARIIDLYGGPQFGQRL